jgi:ribonucleoside-diphosphate reductase beta chain
MTFEYIIETFPFDREEIYSAGFGKKSLADKADFQNKHLEVMLSPDLDIYTLEGKKDFVRSLVAYNIVLEGIWFYSGFMVGMSFRQRNLLRNVGSLLDWITRDENLHLTFGINLLLTILDENPELQTAEFAEEIRNLILEAVELEKAYNEDMLPNGILGLNADYVNQYVMYMTDRRLEELGFEPEYNVSNPAKWMAAANDTLELVNFFESTNTSYEVNSGN